MAAIKIILRCVQRSLKCLKPMTLLIPLRLLLINNTFHKQYNGFVLAQFTSCGHKPRFLLETINCFTDEKHSSKKLGVNYMQLLTSLHQSSLKIFSFCSHKIILNFTPACTLMSYMPLNVFSSLSGDHFSLFVNDFF